MFIAVPKGLRQKTKYISPANDRIQAVLLETEDGYLMVINIYFPSDRVKRFDSFLTDNYFKNACKKFDVDFTHEFEKNETTYTSTITLYGMKH